MTDEVRQTLTIDAPAEKIWDVITDFDNYPEWTRHMSRAQVTERDDQGRAITVEFTMDAKVAIIDYVLSYEYGQDRLDWHLVNSDLLTHLDGTYIIEAAGPDRSVVTYELAAGITLPIPGFLRRRAARVVQETSLHGLAERVATGMAA